jgi:hypothetical protein
MAGVDPMRVQGRLLSEADLQYIRDLRREYPQWSRRQLSDHLVEHWQWYNEAGRAKDMAARTLLLKLQARGLIDLPAPRNGNGNRQRQAQGAWLVQGELLRCEPEPISCSLGELQPLELELVRGLDQRRRVARLLQAHHYQGFSGAVGENVQYLIRDVQGREVAVMVFGAAAWKVADRDEFIGWSVRQRREGLQRITNQQRFLILPWVKVAHLASHLLALATRRLSGDWQQRYGHRVWLVESFVEKQRFRGAAYRAAGWLCVGETTGRTRQDRHHTLQVPLKTVWVRPLHRDFRQHLLLG